MRFRWRFGTRLLGYTDRLIDDSWFSGLVWSGLGVVWCAVFVVLGFGSRTVPGLPFRPLGIRYFFARVGFNVFYWFDFRCNQGCSSSLVGLLEQSCIGSIFWLISASMQMATASMGSSLVVPLVWVGYQWWIAGSSVGCSEGCCGWGTDIFRFSPRPLCTEDYGFVLILDCF